MTHQIEQLKEEISIKDSTLVREQLGRKKVKETEKINRLRNCMSTQNKN